MEKLLLFPGCFYHIFNHAVGKDNFFVQAGNYEYFLKKYIDHIPHVADTFTYCLMPNHIHLIVRIKEVDELAYYFSKKKAALSSPEEGLVCESLKLSDSSSFDNNDDEYAFANNINLQTLQHKISKQFGNFFSAYTQAFNKQQKRRGNLFISNFERKIIDNAAYFCNAVHYLHFNPVHHGFTIRPEDWPFSSFASLLSDKPTRLCREELFVHFGGREAFLAFHGKSPDWSSPPEFFGF